MKRTRGAEGRKDVTRKSENHYHLCSGAHLPALSSTQGLELPNGATPARVGMQEKLTCYSKRMVIWSPLPVQPPELLEQLPVLSEPESELFFLSPTLKSPISDFFLAKFNKKPAAKRIWET